MATDRALAHLLLRLVSGLIWFMAGWWKCFHLGPVGHARQFFLTGFTDAWMPEWLLWIAGVTVPVVELLGGALLLLGMQVRVAAIGLSAVLGIVTYGHLLKEPLYDTTSHIFPRTVLLAALLLLPRIDDRFGIDGWRRQRRLESDLRRSRGGEGLGGQGSAAG